MNIAIRRWLTVSRGDRSQVGIDLLQRLRGALGCLLVGCVVLNVVTGCKSKSPSRYVSPRIIGRVMDARTGQPIVGVQVKRIVPDYNAGTLNQVKGGETLQRPLPVRSDSDGNFILPSQKSLSFLWQLAWFNVEISFVYRGYENFVTNYTPANVVKAPNGEPVIDTGEIKLAPRVKLRP